MVTPPQVDMPVSDEAGGRTANVHGNQAAPPIVGSSENPEEGDITMTTFNEYATPMHRPTPAAASASDALAPPTIVVHDPVAEAMASQMNNPPEPESGATRIRVRPLQTGSSISVTPAGPASPVTGAGHKMLSPPSTGLRRVNHPGQINLSGLRPSFQPDGEEVPAQDTGFAGPTGLVDADDDVNARLANLSRALDGAESEGASEAPPPGQAIIRDEAFLPGLATVPPEEKGELPDAPVATAPSTPGTSEDSFSAGMSHIPIMEGETDGMPTRRRRSRKKHGLKRSATSPWSKVRGMLGGRGALRDEESFSEKDAYGGEEATNTKSVAVLTSTGMRGQRGRHRPTALERRAAKLVRAHKTAGASSVSEDRDAHLGGRPSLRRPSAADSDTSAASSDSGVDPRPVASTGVLGQLLKLYDQENGSSTTLNQDADQSERPSPVSEDMPASSPAEPLAEHRVNEDGQIITSDEVVGTQMQESITGVGSPPSFETAARRSSVFPGGAGLAHMAGNNLTSVGYLGQQAIKSVANDVGIDVMDERPKASRSAAGTIGALVATTGNLIGAVSPLHAQLGPNPKRPGYTLDRYLLPEMNEKTLRRTAKIVAEAAPVPKKMRMPNTPGGGQWTPGSGLRTPSAMSPYANMKGSADYNPYFADAKVPPPPSTSASKRAVGVLQHPMSVINTAGRTMANKAHWSSEDGPPLSVEEEAKREWQRKLRRRKPKSKKQEIFITLHVAAILQRQEFIMKFSRALMMFGAPTHRIELQIQRTASVLEVNCRCVYLPNLLILSFGDESTHTSETRIIKQASSVDLTKLTDMHTIYWNVIHDKVGVEQASKQLDTLMRRRPLMGRWQQVVIAGLASAFISVGSWGFAGGFLDAVAACVLGGFMAFCQFTITSEVYSSVFEIVFAIINSFVAMALHHIGSYHDENGKSQYGRYFCYGPVVGGSIVLILPGFIVLTGALELQAKSVVAGSVRLVYAVIYSVMLGLGLMIGALPLLQGSDDASKTQCSTARSTFPAWYNKVPGSSSRVSFAWLVLVVPGYATLLSLRNQAKPTRKEFPTMVFIAVAGWVVSNFGIFADMTQTSTYKLTSMHRTLDNHPYLYSTMGSFTIGVLANLYGQLFDGRSFVVAVPGILYQLPSGMSAGSTSFLNFATLQDSNTADNKSAEVTSGFQIGAQLLNVSLGIAIGLFAASLLIYFLGGRRARGRALFSF